MWKQWRRLRWLFVNVNVRVCCPPRPVVRACLAPSGIYFTWRLHWETIVMSSLTLEGHKKRESLIWIAGIADTLCSRHVHFNVIDQKRIFQLFFFNYVFSTIFILLPLPAVLFSRSFCVLCPTQEYRILNLNCNWLSLSHCVAFMFISTWFKNKFRSIFYCCLSSCFQWSFCFQRCRPNCS